MAAMQIFMALTKVDAERREVHGRAAQEVEDKAGEILDYESSKPLFERWSQGISDATNGKSLGNVRAMHGNVAAGKLIDLQFDDDSKAIDVVAKVVDDDEWKKVQEGVYTGFSIGGKYAKRWTIDGVTHYTADPVEVSLVDNPAIPTATFSLIKMDGGDAAKGEPMSKKDESRKPDEGDYGTHEETGYADPGYQDDDKPRYPLKRDGKLSPERIRAAWNYIHKEKDGDKYTDKELARIKARIVSAWKKAIDPEGPPEAEEDDDARKSRRDREDEHKKSVRAEADKEAEPDDAEKARRSDMDKADDERRKSEDDEAEKARKTKKAAEGPDLSKGMNSVSALAQILSGVSALQSTAEWESAQEGDDSPIPEKLREAVQSLGEILTEMADEEVKELAANPKTPNPYPSLYLAAEALLQKRGARHSAADLERVQKIHDLAIELGADSGDAGTAKAASGDLAKAVTPLQDELRKAQDSVTALTGDLQKAVARIEQLEQQPAPAKGSPRAVSKAADAGGDEPHQIAAVRDPSGQEAPVASLIKAVHAGGGRPLIGG